MNKKLILISCLLLLNSIWSFSQKDSPKKTYQFNNKGKAQQNNNTGQGVQKITNKYYTYLKDKNYQHIEIPVDTTRPIVINIGGNWVYPNNRSLRKGYFPLAGAIMVEHNDTSTLKVQLKKKNLFITSRCYSFDDKLVFKIKEDTVFNKYDNCTLAVNSIQVKDNHEVPVYQITINKAENSITLYGLFFSDIDYKILSKKGTRGDSYPKSYYLMTQQQRDRIFYEIRQIAYELLQ